MDSLCQRHQHCPASLDSVEWPNSSCCWRLQMEEKGKIRCYHVNETSQTKTDPTLKNEICQKMHLKLKKKKSKFLCW